MKLRSLLLSALLVLPASAFGQTGYSITGGMCNFDVHNECDDPCDEFEVEIEDIRPEDVVHCYCNSNYHCPTITLSAGGTSTIIDYRNPTHTTAVGAIEHFGITLRQLSTANAIRVRWMRNGRSATVNGQVPVPGGSAPATQPLLPSITADLAFGSTGGDGVALTVTNNDTTQAIWIQRRATVRMGLVTLEALMPNDPVVTSTLSIDPGPIFLAAGASMTLTSDLVEIEDNQSAIFAARYFQDLTQVGPFNNSHVIGPELGNVMTASIASPGTGCDVSSPIILVQPQSTEAALNHSVDLRVNADGNDLTLSYQWLKEGLPITNGNGYSGALGDELSIDELTPAKEGFYSVRVTNTCGQTVSNSALVFITGHNEPPVRPVCAADFNGDAAVSVQDIFDFLSDWFAFYPGADFNQADGVTVQDIFDFLAAWFQGC